MLHFLLPKNLQTFKGIVNTFPLKYYLYRKIQLSNKGYFYLFTSLCIFFLNILKAHTLKFPKSPNVHYKRGFGNRSEIGMDCPVLREEKHFNNLTNAVSFELSISLSFIPSRELSRKNYIFLSGVSCIVLINLDCRQFHKTLPKSNAFINWISVRFYETVCSINNNKR